MGKMAYVIGQPGSGKTTLIRTTLRDVPCSGVEKVFSRGKFEGIVYPGGVTLGQRRGTDSLSMSVQPRILQWLAATSYPVVIAEGDRLANDKFFAAVRTLGWILHVLWLDCPDNIAAQRRAARGTTQNESWIRGRCTKVKRLAASWADTRLDASLPPGELADTVKRLEEFQLLRGDIRFGEAKALTKRS